MQSSGGWYNVFSLQPEPSIFSPKEAVRGQKVPLGREELKANPQAMLIFILHMIATNIIWLEGNGYYYSPIAF